MRFLLNILITSLAVFLTAFLLKGGIHLQNYSTAILVAVVLVLLNNFLKPILIFFTIPLTIFTLGLFLIVINASIILIAGEIVSGFIVDGFWWAVGFSIILSIITSIMNPVKNRQHENNDNKEQ